MQTSPLLRFKFNSPPTPHPVLLAIFQISPADSHAQFLSFADQFLTRFPSCSTFSFLRFSLYERDSPTRKEKRRGLDTFLRISIRHLAMAGGRGITKTQMDPDVIVSRLLPGCFRKASKCAVAEKPKTSRIVRGKIPLSIGTFAILFSHCTVSTIFLARSKRTSSIANFRTKQVNNHDWIDNAQRITMKVEAFDYL